MNPARRPSAVFLNRFYWPDVAATAQMLTDLAEDLAAQGWDVTVIASAAGYEHRARLPLEQTRAGVRILRVRGTRFGRQHLSGRALDYLSYLAGVLRRLLLMPRPDVVVAMSDPPFCVAVAQAARLVRGFRVAYWVQDVYPQLAVELGVLRRGSLLERAAARLAHVVLRGADAVIALGPRMAETLIAAGARPERTSCVHNWTDGTLVRPVEPTDNPFLRAHGLEGKFVVLYSGNAGRGHTFDAVIEAMAGLRDDPDVVFLFIGSGNMMPQLKARVAREQWPHVRFLDYVPRGDLAFSLSSASVSLVTEKPEVVGLLVPSKTYGIMASGRPLLFVGAASSDVAQIVRDSGCGHVIPPDDPAALVSAIRALKADPALAAALGARGRRAVETTYDRAIATRHWARAVRRAVGAAPAASNLPDPASGPAVSAGVSTVAGSQRAGMLTMSNNEMPEEPV